MSVKNGGKGVPSVINTTFESNFEGKWDLSDIGSTIASLRKQQSRRSSRKSDPSPRTKDLVS
jgi:hypothetical protein